MRLYRQTDDENLAATFFPGSAIRAKDLNDNFTQNLYVTQESSRDTNVATDIANLALTTSNTAQGTANTALSVVNVANTKADTAITTANTAAANATTALSTANAADVKANDALVDSAQALSRSNVAITDSAAAVATATNAASEAAAAVVTANSANTKADSAVSTANAADSKATTATNTANSAPSTANTALTDSNTAITTSNAAAVKAQQAIDAVGNSLLYAYADNVASIPSTPQDRDAIEVINSTGIEGFTPLNGVPAGFVGDPGLSVRIIYSATNSTWGWVQYFANDPENRYGDSIVALQGDVTTLQGGLATAYVEITGLQNTKLDSTTAASTYLTQTNAGSTYQTQAGMSSYLTTTAAGTTYAPKASPTFTGTVTIPAGASISGYLTTSSASSTYQTQAGMSSYLPTSSIGVSVQGYDADTVKRDVLPVFTVATRTTERTITAGSFNLATANLWTCGAITVPNPTNATIGQTGAIRITSGPVVWSSNFKFPGGTPPTIATFPAIIPFYVQGATTNLMGNVVEGIA